MSDPVVAAPARASPAADGENAVARDEDFSKEYEPVVRLAQVETKTGEEDEECIFKIRSKLFRFSKELSEWKERGTGDVRILKHKDNKKIRLLMRREKTLKICLNHYVNPTVELHENLGSDRSWVWHGVDYADGERDEALLAIRFRDSTNANLFKEAYDSAREYMRKLLAGEDPDEDTATPAAQPAESKPAEAEADKKEDEKPAEPAAAEETKETTEATA